MTLKPLQMWKADSHSLTDTLDIDWLTVAAMNSRESQTNWNRR